MRTLVVGFGTRERGDDGVGLEVAELVEGVASTKIEGDPFHLMDTWNDYDHVVLVDAMRSGLRPGSILRTPVNSHMAARREYASTHGLGPIELVELARALDRLPQRVEIVGIEAGSFDIGQGLSDSVAASAAQVAKELSRA